MTDARFLISDGPDARTYEIRRIYPGQRLGTRVMTFTTGGVNGKTADDTAIGNLADYSERHEGRFILRRDGMLPAYTNESIPVAEAEYGLVRIS